MNGRSAPSLRQLQYFVALAEAQHYRKAAEKVGVTQPSLSLQISNLEGLLGLTLVERGRMGATLTPAGREVLAHAKSVLSEVGTLMSTTEQLTGSLAGTFQLGASATLGPYLLPRVVERLHKSYPDLRLFIRDGAPQDLLQDLLAGRHDMILTQLPVQSTDVIATRLFREQLHLVVARDHRLAKARKVTNTELAGENVLSLSPRFTLHAQIAEMTRDMGASLLQDYEGTSLDAIRQMVAMSMGVSFLPSLYVASEIRDPAGDVTVLPFRPGRFTRTIGLVWRKSAGQTAGYAKFADVIRDVTRTHFGKLVQLEP